MPSIFSTCVSFNKFREIAFHFASAGKADVLLGAPDYLKSCKSYLCINPEEELILEAGTGRDELADLIRKFSFADNRPAVGYLSYECGHVLRGVISPKDIDFPYVHLKKYAAILAHDSATGTLEFIHGKYKFQHEIERVAGECVAVPYMEELPSFEQSRIAMSLGERDYTDGVARTLDFIRSGLTYQLNLTTKFTLPAENIDPVLWFFALNKEYPAPYYALFSSVEKMIISTSPELFLRVENGKVSSEPIKGTLRFDKYSEELKRKLTTSIKEDSELSMIVDLVRNDISADCRYGSVVVEDHKSVFAVDNLLQMYSRVRGELAAGSDCIDLLLNAFPGGSITGCPKKSSMELIDQLEPHTRGPYCGSMVILQSPRDLVSSIAIRTAVHDAGAGEICYWAGSGIVIDSVPESEYQETVAKAGKIINPELV